MALQFTGGTAHQYASINFPSNGPYTFAVRGKQNAVNPPFDYLYGSPALDAESTWLGYTDVGTLRRLRSWTGGTGQLDYSALDPLDSLWHHYAITYDGTTARAYIDGTQVASAAVSFAARANYTLFEVGYATNISVQDTVVWTRALSAAEVAGIAAYRSTGSMGTGVYTWVPMKNGAADPRADVSGNGHPLQNGGSDVADAAGIPDAPPVAPAVGGGAGTSYRGGSFERRPGRRR